MPKTTSKSKKPVKAKRPSTKKAKAKKAPGKGWHGDPVRHKLARYGISTTLPDGRRLDVSKFLPAKGAQRAKYPGRFPDAFHVDGGGQALTNEELAILSEAVTRIYGYGEKPEDAGLPEWFKYPADTSYDEWQALYEYLTGNEEFQDRGAIPGEPGGGMVANGLHTTDVIQRNKDAGHHFFDDDTMRFFNSKVHPGPLYKDKYFITSEVRPHEGRHWNIREFNPENQRVSTTMGEHKTLKDAKAAMEEL